MKIPSLERLLTSPAAFAVPATPLQRAICRASDGEPIEHWLQVAHAFGGVEPVGRPHTMVVLSGIRAGKTTIVAASAYRMAMTIDVDGVIPGDEIRIPILSVTQDAASATFGKLAGMIQARPALSNRLIGTPGADALWLRHPSGVAVEIKVVALAKYGQTVVSRWLGGIIFDEGPLMAGEENVRNLVEARLAAMGRVRPGGQEWIIGSPWGAVGPVYDLVQEHFGRNRGTVIVRAPGPEMNPVHWTPEMCEQVRTISPRAHRTNVLAEFADPEEALYPHTIVEPAQTIDGDEVPEDGTHYVAAIDPATRGNAWTLVVMGHHGFGGPGGTQPMLRVALLRQWIGSTTTPLNPDAVLEEIAATIAPYGLTECLTDQWAADALRALGVRHGLDLQDTTVDHKNRLEYAETLRSYLALGCLALPRSRALRQDLVGVKKRVTVNGHTLVLPKTGDGRHSDFVPPLCLAVAHVPEPPDEPEQMPDGEPVFAADPGGWAGVTGTLLTRC